ncbi:isopentenyl-diphosphate Delta-isomerase [Providencia rustigianii]|uniref:isopentenyl-diphosphate Delta-isomerase n=1 Tax=Providencia rustigianii TaxID=158850 RepID=UPI000F6D42A9|nr:isopentenyl-diphosphate Delta-isomerase [Providencia rustigianii]MTC61252.1 isopentenyl-diphosphate Delta-isomerase [Providencia rustigianii]VEH53866.1 Isopentenyl-diphosphate Delta-isomerase [Providencia rustigianii]
MMKEEQLILVNEQDIEIGTMPKLLAHQEGRLHRAFSIFIFNNKNELLIQQRAFHKYHSAGQWANSCCSHPRPQENTLDAAIRRLDEELGFKTELKHVDAFIYYADVNGGLIEHEYDHIFVGYYNGDFKPNSNEVNAVRWVGIELLNQEVHEEPTKFTPWFKAILAKYPLLNFTI